MIFLLCCCLLLGICKSEDKFWSYTSSLENLVISRMQSSPQNQWDSLVTSNSLHHNSSSISIAAFVEVISLWSRMGDSLRKSKESFVESLLISIFEQIPIEDLPTRIGSQNAMEIAHALYLLHKYEESWMLSTYANLYAARSSGRSYQADLTDRQFLQTKQIFSSFFASSIPTPDVDDSDVDVIFILGFPGSFDVNFLQLLNMHPQALALGAFARNLTARHQLENYALIDGNFIYLFDELIGKIASASSTPKSNSNSMTDLSWEQFRRRFHALNQADRNLILSLTNDTRKASMLPIIDSNWMNYRYLGFIKYIFPHAKFLHVYDHPIQALMTNYLRMHSPNYLGKTEWSFALSHILHEYDIYLKYLEYWNNFPVLKNSILSLSRDTIMNRPLSALKTIQKHFAWKEFLPNIESIREIIGSLQNIDWKPCKWKPFFQREIQSLDSILDSFKGSTHSFLKDHSSIDRWCSLELD